MTEKNEDRKMERDFLTGDHRGKQRHLKPQRHGGTEAGLMRQRYGGDRVHRGRKVLETFKIP
jgi:hypothetical protein